MVVGRIAVDSREEASGIPEMLRKRGIYTQTRVLDVADYVAYECAVERKTVRDFVSSLYKGRLFDQAKRLSNSYEQYLLIVEGDIQETLSDLKNPRVFWGALLTLSIGFDFRVLFTLDKEQTADLLYILAIHPHRISKAPGPLLISKPRMASTRDWQLALLESLPTIGPKLALKLLASFGSVRNVMRASKVELAVKGGIGEARAKRVQEVLDAQFGKPGPKQSQLV